VKFLSRFHNHSERVFGLSSANRVSASQPPLALDVAVIHPGDAVCEIEDAGVVGDEL